MTTTDYAPIPVTRPERRRFAPAGLLARWWTWQRQQRRMRRDMMELSRLDPYLLRDIGLTQADLRDALRGRRYSNPLRRDGFE